MSRHTFIIFCLTCSQSVTPNNTKVISGKKAEQCVCKWGGQEQVGYQTSFWGEAAEENGLTHDPVSPFPHYLMLSSPPFKIWGILWQDPNPPSLPNTHTQRASVLPWGLDQDERRSGEETEGADETDEMTSLSIFSFSLLRSFPIFYAFICIFCSVCLLSSSQLLLSSSCFYSYGTVKCCLR